MPSDDLAAFIAELRAKLEAGQFAGYPPIWLGNELTLENVERAVGDMLAEAAMFASMSPEERRRPHFAARRRYLADNLRRLQERLGYNTRPHSGHPSDARG